jgi:sec-independent protein translocase protein TatB
MGKEPVLFDVGWSELMVIAIVAVLVVGPKDLPRMLRTFGKTVGNLRRMAGDFQRQFDNAMREAELDEIRKAAAKPFAPLEDARKAALDFQASVNKSVAELESAPAEAMPAPVAPSGTAKETSVTSAPVDTSKPAAAKQGTAEKAKPAPKAKPADTSGPAAGKTAAKPKARTGVKA